MTKQRTAQALKAHAARERARRANRSAEEASRERLRDAVRKRTAKERETPRQAASRRARNADRAQQRRSAQRASADAWTFRADEPHPPHPSDGTDLYNLDVIPQRIYTFVNACPHDEFTCLRPLTQIGTNRKYPRKHTCEAGHTAWNGSLSSIPVTLAADHGTYTATIVNRQVAARLFPSPNANPLDHSSLSEQRKRRLDFTGPVRVKATTHHRNHTTFITKLEVLQPTAQPVPAAGKIDIGVQTESGSGGLGNDNGGGAGMRASISGPTRGPSTGSM